MEKGNGRKYSVLIASSEPKSTDFIRSGLDSSIFEPVTAAASAKEARALFAQSDFDIIIINAPLSDEFGDEFAAAAVSNRHAAVMTVVKKDLYARTAEKAEESGFLCVSKPISKEFFSQAARFLVTMKRRLESIGKQTASLKSEVEEMKLVGRAKFLLMEKLGMTEDEAYKYIEKQAMDLCIRKSDVAKRIIITYEI